jgi:SNF2 family DNA or RNA helicase
MRKTSITLAAFELLRSMKMTKSLLVLAPLRVCYTSWPQEVAKWDDFKHLSVGILHGPKKDKVLREKHDVYLVNYEGLEWLLGELSTFKKLPFDMLVVDESTKLKHTNTKRFKLIKPWLPRFTRRVILTGTPAARNLLDLFGQCFVMDSGQTLGRYITRYRDEFFYQSGFGGYTWLPKQGAEDDIFARLAPRCYYAHDEDWLKLPEIIEKDIGVELPAKAKAAYDQLEATLRLDFKSGRVTAANAGVVSMKCRQVANGGVYLDGAEKTWQNIHDAKTDAVLDLVDELQGQPALITYDFRHDLDRLKKALGKDTPHIGYGGVKPARMQELIKSWNRSEIPYIIVSAASMAHGVDGLQEAGRAVIWHSLTYNFEDYDQLVRRLRRSGQRERVLVAHIIAAGTVDTAILAMLRQKDAKQRTLFAALRDYWA